VETIAVAKFGGTSVKSIARIRHVAEIVKNIPSQKRVIVVSAMGDTTDHLLSLAQQCSEFPDQRELDVLMSTGEQVSIALLSLTLRAMGIKARSYTGAQIRLLTDDQHTAARILEIDREFLASALQENDVVIVAGFQGINTAGDITTLGRGGSDTSAVALAVACEAPVCEIYTDVDGICSADPNVVQEASSLSQLTYIEVLELARNGAQVIHPRAVELAQQYGVAIRVRNTFNPDDPGTLIDGEEIMEKYDSLSGVSIDRKLACVSLKTADAAAALDKLTDLIEAGQIAADSIVQNESVVEGEAICALSLVLKHDDDRVLLRAVNEIKLACSAQEVVEDLQVAKLSLVGRGLSGRPRYLAKFLSCLSAAGVDPKHVSCSDLRISCIVNKSDADRICRHLHSCFALGRSGDLLTLAATA
jgi:aspartate kinase